MAEAMRGFLTVAGLLILVVMWVGQVQTKARYDQSNSDYRYVKSLIPAGLSPKATIDMSKINGGDWQFICTIGSYSDPEKILRREAAKRDLPVTIIDLVKAEMFEFTPVGELEGAISFLDHAGRGRTVLIDGFHLLAGTRCFDSGTTEVALPFNAR